MNIKNRVYWFKVQGSRFKRKPLTASPSPLTINGIPPAPMTPEPDDAELAAQALLEIMSQRPAPGPSLLGRGMNAIKRKKKSSEEVTTPLAHREGQGESLHDSAYYRALAERIRQAQEASRLRALRFVSFVEQELKKQDLPVSGAGSLGLLEAELMKRIDVIERVGGELKKPWQYCVAQVMVRLMHATSNDNDNENEKTTDDTDSTDKDNGSSQAPQN